MTRHDEIGKALDDALHKAFPSHDVGHPATPHTERARAIMESAIAIAGVPVKVYNFHEVGGYVEFNRSYPTESGGRVIGTWAIRVKVLDALSDAAIIAQYVPRFADYKGERKLRTLKHAPDDR